MAQKLDAYVFQNYHIAEILRLIAFRVDTDISLNEMIARIRKELNELEQQLKEREQQKS